MIPSVDTYVYHEIKSKIKIILQNDEILRETLRNFDKEARDNFISGFGGKNPRRPVDITYVFPQTSEQVDAKIVVQLGESKRATGSIGNIEDNFDYRKENTYSEYSKVTVSDENGDILFIPLEHPIGKILSLENISFAKSDNATMLGDTIQFKKENNEHLIDLDVVVHYESKQDLEEDPTGVAQGYSAVDVIDIFPISSSMDIARCLDAIVRVVLIIMQDNTEEKTGFYLQEVNYGGMQNLLPDSKSVDRLLFSRPITVQYNTSYTVDFDFYRKIKEVIIKERYEYE